MDKKDEPDIFKWIKDQDPLTIPYRPGAPFIYDGFGLRRWLNFGSPIHTGPDRGVDPDIILHPFGGPWIWKSLPKDNSFGSLLRLMPYNAVNIEIQVAHTTHEQPKRGARSGYCKKGKQISGVHVGSLGLSSEPHTHTDVLIPMNLENLSYLRGIGSQWVKDGEIVDDEYVSAHCAKWNLSLRDYTIRVVKQISGWGILEAGQHYLVRSGIPSYRTPHWGSGPVIFLDSKYFLEI